MTWTVSASSSGSAYAAASQTTVVVSTGANTYVFMADMSNMINGDVVSVKLNSTATTATTTPVQAWKGTWQHAQLNPLKMSPPIPSSGVYFSAAIQNVSMSTAETIPWTLLSI